MVKNYIYKIIIFVILCLFSRTVFAANINIMPSGHAGVYDVILTLSNNESINAVEGTILFNENLTTVPNIEKTDSIVSLWTKGPNVSGNSINFSGIMPGGFSVVYDQFGGKPKAEGKLFSIVFPFVDNVSSYTFTLDSTYVYMNDGHGTTIIVPNQSITLPVSTDKNDFSGDNKLTNNPVSNTSNPASTRTIFIILLIIFFLILFYFLKKTHYHVRKILKK